MIKIIEPIDITNLLTAYYRMEKQFQWSDYGRKKQVGLQYKTGDDPWTSAVGRSQGNELSYNILNSYFTNTVFEEIILKYKMIRSRFMWIDPYSCYSMHKDETPRIHIPLITNPQCFFVFKSGIIEHLTTNNVYWVDTRLVHTFMNCSEHPRLHLVGVVES